MSPIDCLCDKVCAIDRKQLARVQMYYPTTAELAAPAQPVSMAEIIPGGVYYVPVRGTLVKMAKVSEVKISWIGSTRVRTIHQVQPEPELA